MPRLHRSLVLITLTAVLLAVASQAVAQRRRPAPPPHRPPARGAVVFIGGYFYDPFFGPYPWWARGAYPYPYYPVFDNRATVRVIAEPKDAGVYVDGFYAGTVHDFNDWFQGLPLPPGGHEVVLYMEGYRTTRDRVYLQAGQELKIRHMLERLPAGEMSEQPVHAPPVPPPPDGTYMPPRTPRP